MNGGQFRGKRLFAGRLFAGRLFGPPPATNVSVGPGMRPLPQRRRRKRNRDDDVLLFLL